MANSEEKRAWVRRVLRVETGGGGPAQKDAALVPGGTLAYRKALLAFAQAKTRVASQLSDLNDAIVQTLPAEADLADQVSADLTALNEEIADAVDAAMNATGGGDARTRALMEAYVERLESDPLIDHVDANPFVPVTIQATLKTALTAILGSMR